MLMAVNPSSVPISAVPTPLSHSPILFTVRVELTQNIPADKLTTDCFFEVIAGLFN